MHHAAIFDMDGLLIDSERSIMQAWSRAVLAGQQHFDEAAYMAVIGVAARESDAILERLVGSAVFPAAKAAVAKWLESDPRDIFALKPGAERLLEVLAERRISCAIASSTAGAEVRRRLASLGVLRHFQVVIGGDQVEHGKPDPALYRVAAGSLGVPPVHCLAFEDSDHGVAAAHAAGIDVVLVPDLKAPSAAARQVCFEELPSLVAALGRLDHWFAQAAVIGSAA